MNTMYSISGVIDIMTAFLVYQSGRAGLFVTFSDFSSCTELRTIFFLLIYILCKKIVENIMTNCAK